MIMSLFYAIVCSTLSCYARLRRAHCSLKRCIYSTSHINRNIAHNPKTQSKMLTLHQFLAYCSRNNIQTVEYYSTCSCMTDEHYDAIHFMHELIRGKRICDAMFDETLDLFLSPRDFYAMCKNVCGIDNLSYAVRRHMRAKCKPQNVFLSDCLPF